MPQSSHPDAESHSQLAPPRIAGRPVQRTGYIILAASGLLLATAFGGIAHFAAPAGDVPNSGLAAHSGDSGTPQEGSATESTGGETTRTIKGEAVAESTSRDSADTSSTAPTGEPTTVVRIGDDGRPTTTTLPSGRSSRHNDRSDDDSGTDTTSEDNDGGNNDGGSSDETGSVTSTSQKPDHTTSTSSSGPSSTTSSSQRSSKQSSPTGSGTEPSKS